MPQAVDPGVTIATMSLDDHPDFVAMMQRTPGVVLRQADGREATARYLARNPGMSFVARWPGRAGIVGCAMSGHDGRRGYLQHVMVDPECRGLGLGRRLTERCLQALLAAGIEKVHLDTLADNADAHRFWTHLGWSNRNAEIVRFSRLLVDDPNA
ncbi:GNAT family N-acetyltransferase [Salinicola endophyticus]|uniref:GNAT family N-acetyltransferase n=1 Tax=Salinicola endophyticus TaxID=1949083 RepID=A0ABY8FGX8_9GAMM|nr:GNAT family N-acetyltransferase [Salinicola endophyticus]WFF41787.1 GNAT family N-acetyltransferase [Salinicola endophyticus]